MRKGEAGDNDSKKKRDGEEQGVGKGTVESGRRTVEKEKKPNQLCSYIAIFVVSVAQRPQGHGQELDLNGGRAREGGDHSGVKSGAYLKQHDNNKVEKAMGGGRRRWKHREK
jgi:hypothetical protein